MSDSSSTTDPGASLLGEYCPFIADVPITSYAEPFPIPKKDTRTDEEIAQIKANIKRLTNSKHFNPPLPLADFCLIAKERWDNDDSDGSECSLGVCKIV